MTYFTDHTAQAGILGEKNESRTGLFITVELAIVL